jgi:SWIM zinc finger
LEERKCSCNRFQQEKVPCCHVIAYLRGVLHENPIEYIDDMYKLSTIINMYHDPSGRESIATSIDDLHIIGQEWVVSPVPKNTKRGCKRMKHIEGNGKGSRGVYGQRKCPVCGYRGHFEKGCPFVLDQTALVQMDNNAQQNFIITEEHVQKIIDQFKNIEVPDSIDIPTCEM